MTASSDSFPPGLGYGQLMLRSEQLTDLRHGVVELVLKEDVAERGGRLGRITIDTGTSSLCAPARRQLVGADQTVLAVERHQLRRVVGPSMNVVGRKSV